MTMPSILPWHVWLSLAAASGLTSVAMYFWPVAFLNPIANMSLGLLMIAAVGGFVLALASRWALGHQSWARAWDWALCTIAMLLLAKLAWNVSIMKWAAVPISKLQMKSYVAEHQLALLALMAVVVMHVCLTAIAAATRRR